MRILVTGGAGFIGSHLVDALIGHGHEVAVVDDLSSGRRENLLTGCQFYELDVRDKQGVLKVFEEFQPEIISHQAAQMSVSRSVREPDFDADVNIMGLINVLQAAVSVKARRVVFASSGGVLYGNVDEPAHENAELNPESPYGISKWVGERYLQFFQKEHGLETFALRYANVYGERQNPHGEAGVVAIFCTKMFDGESYRINGDGKYIRDYVHVSDVVRANTCSITRRNMGFQAFNVGTGVGTDVNQLAAALRPLCQEELNQHGVSIQIPDPEYGPPRPGDLRSNLVSSEKAAQTWSWRPQLDLTSGLRLTTKWFAEKLLH